MVKNDSFKWRLNEPYPIIKEHTDRKLRVIEQYLDIYFDTVAADRKIENINISFVDGFSGGGLYRRENDLRVGSPFSILDAVNNARVRLNIDRRRPLTISAHYYFSDLDQEHINCLNFELSKSEHIKQDSNKIVVQQGAFDELLPKIINDISKRQRSGRSFFVLDQFGYKDVPMQAIREIFSRLNKAEAILTFSIDSLLNYLREDGFGSEKWSQFGVSAEFVAKWNELKNEDEFGRATAQRYIMSHIQKNSGAKFFTPFMLYSESDKRWMVLAHLSNHQTARDKILGVHWDIQNHFKHIGKGSLFELGFDDRILESKDSLFSFTEQDLMSLKQELENELMQKLEIAMNDAESISAERFLSKIGNQTAADNKTIFETLNKFAVEGDLELKKKDGSNKRPTTEIKPSDILLRPKQRRMIFK